MVIENLLSSLSSTWLNIFPLLINLLFALFLLLIGLLVARGLGILTTIVLKTLQLDTGAKQIGFDSILEKGNIKKSASDLMGDLVYWMVALVVLIGVAGIFGLPVERALTKIFAYMGVVFLASLMLGIGLFLANLVSGIVRLVMANFGIEGNRTASRLIYYIVLIFAFFAALGELGIPLDSILPKMDVIIGAFGLAAAIAFGLGCKDMAADFLHNLFRGK
jgi:Mechanosensitive ion channel, conserved TM helix